MDKVARQQIQENWNILFRKIETLNERTKKHTIEIKALEKKNEK